MKTITCPHCHEAKPLDSFYLYPKNKGYAPGTRRPKCKQCQHETRATHRRNNPEMAASTARRHKIKRLFGITDHQYDSMLKKQSGVCAICRRESPDGRRLHIDHNHDTRHVRGLLCHDCNRAIGMFRDCPDLLKSAIKYLKSPPSKGIV